MSRLTKTILGLLAMATGSFFAYLFHQAILLTLLRKIALEEINAKHLLSQQPENQANT